VAKVPVPKLSLIDAAAWKNRLTEAIPSRPDGTPITIWGQFPDFVKSLRGQRDFLNAHAVELNDHKKDIDNHTERLNSQAARIAALEKQPTATPFPES
jgi:hypothetical protein